MFGENVSPRAASDTLNLTDVLADLKAERQLATEGFVSVREIQEELERQGIYHGDEWVREKIKRLQREGRVETRRIPATMMDGRPTMVGGYRLRGV